VKQLVVFPKGSISPKDKERMSKEGFLAVEADDPSKVVMVMPSGDNLSSTDLLMSAMTGIVTPHPADRKAVMLDELHRRLQLKDKAHESNT